jgi:hypothetical protein
LTIATTLVAAALHYLLPLGTGLLLTRPLARGLTRTQLLLLSYLVGLVAIACVFVSRERGWGFNSPPDLIDLGVFLAAAAGFVLARRVFRWDAAARSATREFMCVLPFFAVGFALRFGTFSDYPLTDLFQFTHLMKAALEFGRFDRVNPFTADSYAPVLPVVDGVLVRALAYDPLQGHWFVSALSVAPKFLALRAAMLATLEGGKARTFALAAAACFLSPVASTNGELAMLGALLLFACIAGGGGEHRARGALAVLVVVVGYAAAHLAVRRLDPLAYLAVMLLACALPRIAIAGRHSVVAPIGLLPIVLALAPMHRSALVFVPVGATCAWLLAVARERAMAGTMIRRALPAITGASTAAAGIGVAVLAVFLIYNPDQELRDNSLSRWVTATILGTDLSANADVLLGSGPRVALFELARAMSPSFALTTGLAMFLAWRAARNRRDSAEAADVAAAAHYAMSAWLIALALFAMLLVGFPFAYRAGFFVVVLLAIALGTAMEVVQCQKEEGVGVRALLAAALVYIAVIVPIAYQCAPWAGCQRSEYLEMARSYVWILGGVCVVAALTAIVVSRLRHLPDSAVPLILSLLFAFEFSVLTAYFMPYHYGPVDRSASAVGHLGREEIDLAARLRPLGADTVLLSDPHTLANLKALTGLNGLLTASNLDTIRPQARAKLREWLRAVLERGGASEMCAPHSPLRIREAATAREFDYWLTRRAWPSLSGRDALRKFGYRDALITGAAHMAMLARDPDDTDQWIRAATALLGATAQSESGGRDPWKGPMILLVVNRKTVAWALGEGGLPYYPDLRPLDDRLLAQLARRCDLRVEGDGRFALVRFPLVAW